MFSLRVLSAFMPVLLILTRILFAASGPQPTALLRSGTPVFVVFDQSVDSETAKEGDTIYLRVLRPVQVDGVVVIRPGEKVRSKVTEVRRAGGWGKRGDLSVRVESTSAVDGQEISLSAVQR
jgi:hypothetical protein